MKPYPFFFIAAVIILNSSFGQQVSLSNDVLYDQTYNFSTEPGVVSQLFPDEPDLICQAADDFNVPAGENWIIENIYVPGYYSSVGIVNMANIYFYIGGTDIPGPMLFALLDQPVQADPFGNLEINIPSFVLNEGRYWLSVQPVMPYYIFGQWLWKKQDSPTINYEFSWKNPGGGWYGQYYNWSPASLIWGVSGQTDWNLSFRLMGQRNSFTPPPFITHVFPSGCFPGQTIHLAGSYFGSFTPDSFIEIDGIPYHMEDFIWLDNHILFRMPFIAAADSINLRVLNGPMMSNVVRLGFKYPVQAIFTSPLNNEICRSDTLSISAYPESLMDLIDTAYFYYRSPGETNWTLLGRDTCGKSVSIGGVQPNGNSDGWSYDWDVSSIARDTFEIRAVLLDQFGQQLTGNSVVRIDKTPFVPIISDSSRFVASLALNNDSLNITFEIKAQNPGQVEIWGRKIPDDGSRVLDTCNQNKLHAEDNNWDIADPMACGPVAAASCLKWLAKTRFPGSDIDTMQTRNLAKRLVKRCNTNLERGTTVDDLMAGMKGEFNDNTPGQLKVNSSNESEDIMVQLFRNFIRKEDVLIAITQEDANGKPVNHMVTMSSYHVSPVENKNTSTPEPTVSTSYNIDIDFMDPATGEIDTFRVVPGKPPSLQGYKVAGANPAKPANIVGGVFARPGVTKNFPGDTLFHLASIPTMGPGIYHAVIRLDSLSTGMYILDAFADSLANDSWSHSYALAYIAPYRPLALFVADQTYGYPPFEVQFNNFSSPIDSLIYYKWDFGDGDTSHLVNPVHTYNAAGLFNVSLIVSDGSTADTIIRTDYIYSGITLDIQACLEGPFNGNSMDTLLNSVNMLPLTQPFNKPPWNYSGPEAVSEIPDPGIVDWVLIELRDAGSAADADASTTFARQAAFLHSDGSITGLDGRNLPYFNNSFNTNLFVVIHHRNHLSIISANPISVSEGAFSCDFTSSSGQVFGGINGQKLVALGKWAMFSGDGDSNGQVNQGDKIEIWHQQVGNTGYIQGDFNMNGQVDNIDKNFYWRPNAGRGSQVP